MKRKKPGVYVVFEGRKRGVYQTWPECKEQVSRYPNTLHKKYQDASKANFAFTEYQRYLEQTFGSLAPAREIIDNEVAPASTAGPTGTLPQAPAFTSPLSGSSVRYTPSLKRSATFNSASSVTSLHTADFRVIECVDLTGEPDDLEEPPAKRARRETPEPTPEVQSIPVKLDGGDCVSVELPSNPKEPRITLSPEQERVVQLALSRNNIFLTGAAGSGKTVTLKEILQRMKDLLRRVQVVAPTGISALPLGGKTTYSFAGWNPDSFRKGIHELLGATKKRTIKAIKEVDVLVVEEISMVENQFLERLDSLFQFCMENKLPFGGKQVIFLGDFHQLPPVKPFGHCLHCGESIPVDEEFACVSVECRAANGHQTFNNGDKWAFKAPVWKRLNLRHVRLEQIHRQKDTRFQDILNKIRNGVSLSAQEWSELERHKDLPKDAYAVRLMSMVVRVTAFNMGQLAALKFQAKTWKALDTCKKLIDTDADMFDRSRSSKMDEHWASLRDHSLPEELTLKFGARVVLLHNLDHDRGLVNGSQGKIIGFQKAIEEIEKILDKNGGDHKEFRHASMMEYHATNTDWRPLVRFANGITRLIPAIATASIRGPRDRYQQYVVCRTQIPLTLAWALSIHKSQGMTLEYVEVSSRDIFESGQLYVALSRATHLNGLKLTGFSRDQLPMDPTVLEFYTTTQWEKLKPDEEKDSQGLSTLDVNASQPNGTEPQLSVAAVEPDQTLSLKEDSQEIN